MAWGKAPAPPVVLPPDPVRELAIAVLGALISLLVCLIGLVLRGGSSGNKKESSPAPKAEAPPPPSTRASTVDPIALQSLLESRRSVTPKDYTGGAVAEELVRSILSAAPWAPNHGKTEPWRFVVFGGEHKELLLGATLDWHLKQPPAFWQANYLLKAGPEFADGAAFAKYYREEAVGKKWGKTSHLVAICLRRQRPSDKKRIPEWEELCACACTVQNMHLKATSLGVGAYWSSWYEVFRTTEECVRFLGLSPAEGDLCIGVFVIGECIKLDQIRGVRQPLDSVVEWR